MMTTRRAFARFHPLFLSFMVAVGATVLLAALVVSLAQTSISRPVTLFAAVASSGAGMPFQALPAQAAPADATPVEFAPGVVLVKLKPGAAEALAGQGAMTAQGGAGATAQDGAAAVAGLFQSYGVTGAEPLLDAEPAAPYGLRAAAGAGAAPSALANVYRLRLAPQFDAQQMALALAADPGVEYAEPD